MIERNERVLARPGRFPEGGLTCHGGPAQSPTMAGLDALGSQMEDMKPGKVMGAIVLKATLTNDTVVATTMMSLMLVSPELLGVILAGFHVFNVRFANRPPCVAIARIKGPSRHTAGGASQTPAASQVLADAASEQPGSLEEMASMTRRNAASARNAQTTTAEAPRNADDGTLRIKQRLAARRMPRSASRWRAALTRFRSGSGTSTSGSATSRRPPRSSARASAR